MGGWSEVGAATSTASSPGWARASPITGYVAAPGTMADAWASASGDGSARATTSTSSTPTMAAAWNRPMRPSPTMPRCRGSITGAGA